MRTRHTLLALGLPLGSLLMAMTARAEPLVVLNFLPDGALSQDIRNIEPTKIAPIRQKKQAKYKQKKTRLSRVAAQQHKVERRKVSLVKPATLFPHCAAQTVKWQRSCDEMGYPASFSGFVVGVTQIDCQAGERREAWIQNSCAAPVIASVQMATVEPSVAADKAAERADTRAAAQPVAPASGEAQLQPPLFVTESSRSALQIPADDRIAAEAPLEVNPAVVTVSDDSATLRPPLFLTASEPRAPLAAADFSPAIKPAVKMAIDEPLPAAAPRMSVDMAALPEDLSSVVPEEKPAVVAVAAPPVTKDHMLKQSSRCGSAAGRVLVAAPQAELCIDGLASQIIGDGPWQWSCEGADGSQTACFAMVDTVQLAANKAMPDAALKIAENRARIEASAPEIAASDLPNEMAAAPVLHARAIENTASTIPEPAVAATTTLTTPQLPGVTLLAAATESEPLATAALATPRLSLAAAQTDAVVPVADSEGGAILDADLTALPFAPGEEALSDELANRLETVGQRLAVNRLAHVTVTAYAGIDDQTDARMARRRSLARALAVRDALLLGGASSDQIRVRARGANVVSGEPDRVDLTDR